MSQQQFFCSELSRRASEKTFGTASIGEVWMLIEYPLAWEEKAFEQSFLSSRIKAHFSHLLKSIPRARLLFIKQGRSNGTGIKFFIARTRERDPFIVKFQLDNYEQLTDVDVAAVMNAGDTVAASGGELISAPLYLVCTHGKRDKCCAKFGYPLYKSLSEAHGESVWQSSHVGGDRFAANLVVFPHGLFYAHATEESAPAIIKEHAAGRLSLDNYRGRACYANQTQAAEYFIRTESGLTGLDELKFLRRERLSETSWRVQFAGARDGMIHEAQVASRRSKFQIYATCHAAEEKNVNEFVLQHYSLLDALSHAG